MDGGHVGHGAASGEIREHDLLVFGGENVGALRHEVHTAEDDELRLRMRRGLLGELERVAGGVGELDDLIALVVVAEDVDAVAEGGLGRGRTRNQIGVAGGREVAGAFDAALALGIRALPEEQQGERGGSRLGKGHVGIVAPASPPCPGWIRSADARTHRAR